MRLGGLVVLCVLTAGPAMAFAEEALKIEPLKEAAPSQVAAAIKAELNPEGYRVLKDGKPYAAIWLRKATPVAAKPGGPNGAVLFPVLSEGQLIGAFQFFTEGQDYRDQAITAGVYTIRYGLQPINGDHLGVSPSRDYALLVPAAKDTATANIARKGLEERSAEAAGTSHPAVLLLLSPPSAGAKTPSMAHDEAKQTWGAVVSLPIAVKGSTEKAGIDLQIVVSGAAAP